ncbi:MAG: outer membrane beta-barrel protein, partial [Candidatus Margulisbacteria bacterium]|nr:outer membrane beta-barrel protein [Candidatus Margulisiibacteriota bacterium]
MKKFWLLISFVLCLGGFSLAAPKLDLGLNMGTMLPNHDTLAQQTFASDFYWQMMLGMVDDSGWEIRGNFGSYWDTSHFNSADIAANRRINLRPLTASLIYNIQGGTIQPYFGAGVGGYFYDVMDDVYGNLESGFKLGFHVLGGIKLRVNENFYLNAEYTQHYLPAVFFSNEKNFDVVALVIGGGFEFAQNPQNQAKRYPYTKAQEDVLMQIQQVEKEIKDLQAKRDK